MRHPYVGLPEYQFWRKEPGVKDASLLDPVGEAQFRLKKSDLIVTAGSCFAQHVARFLSSSGYCHYIAEKPHPVIPTDVAEKHNYGLFSARYGNIYTARQLKQLLLRAYGQFQPLEKAWTSSDGKAVVDPFRPQIQPGGFLSEQELAADQRHHFSKVRDAIEKMDVFVFTLGLTEGWEGNSDGAIFPLAPGVAGGTYDAAKVRFVNFDEAETFQDLADALTFIRAINATVKFILTVSPVPLNATYENRHVLLSTTWSKAVLRVVAEKATKVFSDCVYFPSYEIITSPHVRGAYYEADCREIREEGVEHVMRLFLSHFSDVVGAASATENNERRNEFLDAMTHKVKILCDEAAIDNR